MTPRLRPTPGGARRTAADRRARLGPIRLTVRLPVLLSVRVPVRLLLVLAAVLLPYGTAVAYDPEPLPSDSASASATPEPSRAGTLAGEGRLRPGRPQGPAVKVEGQDADDPDEQTVTSPEPGRTGDESPAASSRPPAQEAGLAPPSASPPSTAHQAVAHSQDDASEPVLHVLPLGSGLVLIGLGLGLAFVGLRVRRS
ncbi:hypothetical protein ACFZDK_11395 [Streptomyces sp. NPDC007901]|uniref:hypothetical protein n=1 Tax=Streptomyces sp. NPDC007901 TaxID=3364785 RepID=UPI0036ED24A1